MNDTISPDAETGLRADQVAQKRAQGRQNVLDDRATKSTAQILKDNVCTLFTLFNLLIAAALALVGAWSNLLFLLVVALNTLIGIAQEVHAKRLVEKLSLLSLPTARVIRDGAPAEIPTQDLVEEDVIELEAGRQVCADAVLLTGAAEVNESLLTGESDPVRAPRASTCSPAALSSAAGAAPAWSTWGGRTTPPASPRRPRPCAACARSS